MGRAFPSWTLVQSLGVRDSLTSLILPGGTHLWLLGHRHHGPLPHLDSFLPHGSRGNRGVVVWGLEMSRDVTPSSLLLLTTCQAFSVPFVQ